MPELIRFSQRIGKRPIKTELEREGLSDELRNTLWTLVHELIINSIDNMPNSSGQYNPLTLFFRALWIDFLKRPIDDLPANYKGVQKESAVRIVRDLFFEAKWYEVYDFVEFCSTYNQEFQKICNEYLKREMSSYRFVDNILVEIDSKEEIVEIENAIKNTNKFQSVKEHLKRSVELYADRKKPDYRNSIKESISAVESLSKIIIGDKKSTLGQALKKIENKHNIPSSLKSAFSALYGYTSDEGGIRHSLLENGVHVDIAEARFMLIACSAFVNYLINKI